MLLSNDYSGDVLVMINGDVPTISFGSLIALCSTMLLYLELVRPHASLARKTTNRKLLT